MSRQDFLLPDLGEGLIEADIAEWRVQVGDVVVVDQVVVVVETAKAAVEVPIPFAGTVVCLHGEEGSTLRVGTPLITVTAGSGNVLIGYGTSQDTRRRRRRVHLPTAAAGAAESSPAEHPSAGSPARVISPIVRRLALQHGIDSAAVPATGASGVVIRADIDRAIQAADDPCTGSARPAEHQRIPLRGLRKVVADKMSTSRREIPDATTWVDVDATDLVAARHAIDETLDQNEKISLLALLARLAVVTLRQFPELNSSVDSGRSEIVRFDNVHLGVAAQTPRGLVVPVIENAESLSTVELSGALRATTDLARAGKLPPNRLTGGTFTLNNYGVFGVDGSTPIINHPEAAILGVGRIADKPWVVDGTLAVRKITQISLTFDHRVCDGGTAGGFLRRFADYVENPVAVLGQV